MACLDFKRNETAEVFVTPPQGFIQAGPPKTVTGTMAAAACSGQGENCQMASLEVIAPHCVTGTVVDGMGNPVSGATVTATYPTPDGKGNSRATTGANGTFCVQTPPDTQVDIDVVESSGGQVLTGESSVSSGSGSAACGSGDCTDGGDITITPSDEIGCVTGTVVVSAAGMAGTPARGTNVYVYAGSAQPSCLAGMDNPSDWGQLLGQTTTDADGDWCLELPITANNEISVITGKCGQSLGAECLGRFLQTQAPMQEATCGSGNCRALTEDIVNAQCGTGP
jgi:hypothetical protein